MKAERSSRHQSPRDVHFESPQAGQVLDSQTRAILEPRFGHSFGDVRVFADGQADRLAQDYDALALTVGQDMYFRHGEYAPNSPSGLGLLAHELTHTIQQRDAQMKQFNQDASDGARGLWDGAQDGAVGMRDEARDMWGGVQDGARGLWDNASSWLGGHSDGFKGIGQPLTYAPASPSMPTPAPAYQSVQEHSATTYSESGAARGKAPAPSVFGVETFSNDPWVRQVWE